LYLPAGRSKEKTGVFVLIHGGGWTGGDKDDLKDFFNGIIQLYPNNAVVNLNYRLATSGSPGNPKQIEDIKEAIKLLQDDKYQLKSSYFLFGTSAGGHLAMLYGYGFDPLHQVKAIGNMVGPCDFTDVAYTSNIFYLGVLAGYTGTIDYSNNKSLFYDVSPVKYVNSESPPTIGFFGETDPLIPISQKSILENTLNTAHVPNKMYVYPGGHGDWNTASTNDMIINLVAFINTHFSG
jgi:acetyl esterase/lipase